MDEHPVAMDLFENMARIAANRGRKFGVKFIAERVRWEFVIDRGIADFKVNNSHVAYIARELIERDPLLEQFIETRMLLSAEDPFAEEIIL